MTVGKGLTREERETVISFDENAKTVSFLTSSPIFLRRLIRLAEAWGVPIVYDRVGFYAGVELPMQSFSLRNPIKLSASERERRAALLRKARTP